MRRPGRISSVAIAPNQRWQCHASKDGPIELSFGIAHTIALLYSWRIILPTLPWGGNPIPSVTRAKYPPEKAFLKINDVCEVFQVSKPTIYDWMKQDKIKGFKIKSRGYFLGADIEEMIRRTKNI